MGSIETAFGSEGYMKTKNVHVGHLIVHDTLDVDDMATFQDDLQVQGTVIAKNGVKIGDTMFTEDKLNKSTTGFNGVMDTWEEPSNKKFKPDNSGRLDSGIPDDPASDKNILMADTILTKNQIVTRTGLLVGYTGKEKEKANKTTPGSEVDDSFILPDRMSSENMYVDNIHERTKDKGVNVQNTLYVGTVGTKASGGAITIDADVKLKDGKSMGSTTLTSVVTGAPITKGPLPGDGDLIVQGNATFKKAVTFEDKSQLVDIPNLKVGDLTVTGKSTGTGNSSDTITTNEIRVKTDNNSISVNAALNAVDYVYKNETGAKSGTDGKFYRTCDKSGTLPDIETIKGYFTAKNADGSEDDTTRATTTAIWNNLKNLIGSKTIQGGTPAAPAPNWEMLQFFVWNHFHFAPLSSGFNYSGLMNSYSSLNLGKFLGTADTYNMDTCFSLLYANEVLGVGTRTMAIEIMDKCSTDKDFFRKWMLFIAYVYSKANQLTGLITTNNEGIVDNNDGTFTLKPVYTGGIFNKVVIDTNTCTFTFFSDNIKVSFTKKNVDHSFNNINADQASVDIHGEQAAALLEYLLLYPFIYFYQHDACGNVFFRNTILAKTAHNTDYIPVWQKNIDNFNNLASYEKWWSEKTEDKNWTQIVWENTSKFVDSIDLANVSGKLNENDIPDAAKICSIICPSYLEWRESNPASDVDVVIEYRRGPTGSSMVALHKTETTNNNTTTITKVDELVKFSTSSMLYPQMEVERMDGDTSMSGNLEVPSISAPDDKPVRIPAISSDMVLINGEPIIPTPNNTASIMNFNPKEVDLYNGKCGGKHSETATIQIDGVDYPVPKIVVDTNYCGGVYFFNIREFIIQGKALVDTYRPTKSKDTGWGRFDIPLDTAGASLNPYGYSVIPRKITVDNTEYDKPTAVYNSSDKKVYPNASNIYMVGESIFRWIKVIEEKNKIRYEVYLSGYMRYYLNPVCLQCISLDWVFDPLGPETTYWVKKASNGSIYVKDDPNDSTNWTKTTVPDWQLPKDFYVPKSGKLIDEFIDVEGISFTALKRDTTEEQSHNIKGFYDLKKTYGDS